MHGVILLEPQNFLQLAHSQPLLWQRELHLKLDCGGEIHCKASPAATASLRAVPNPMPITVPNYSRKIDRLQFGTLIGIPRNPQIVVRPQHPS